MSEEIDKLKARLRTKKIKPKFNGLSTGSTLLNLACSGTPDYGYVTGGYFFFVGDSTSGKTFLTWNCLAEAAINPLFDKYRFIFNNAENGSLMDIEKLFGKEVKQRTEMVISPHLDHFYNHLEDCLTGEKPVIYILDSMDALKPKSEMDKERKVKKAMEKGKEISGTFGVGKAKMNSSRMPEINALLRDTESILLVISQTRDKIGFGSQFDPKTRSGGTALKFFCQLEIWTSVREKLKSPVKGKKRDIGSGIRAKVVVKKNRITGKDRTIYLPIYPSHGVDEVGSMVDFLIDWNHWNDKGKLIAKEFDFSGTKELLVQAIEVDNKVGELKGLVTDVWNEIEESTKVKRKPRYE